MFRVTVAGREQIRAMAVRLRRGHQAVRAELTAGLRRAAEPAWRDVRDAIEGADLSGQRTGSPRVFRARVASLGVRRPIARAVELQVSSSSGTPRAEIVLRDEQVPARIRALVPYFGGRPRLRHPIMGNRRRWAGQNAPNVWWPVMERHYDNFRAEADAALQRAAEQIERG